MLWQYPIKKRGCFWSIARFLRGNSKEICIKYEMTLGREGALQSVLSGGPAPKRDALPRGIVGNNLSGRGGSEALSGCVAIVTKQG